MIDKAAIFTDLTKRNALRKAAHLPLLDLRHEFDHAVATATWTAAVDEHAHDMPRIRDEILAELRESRGPEFDESRSAGARWLIHFAIQQRFFALLAQEGVRPPVPHHAIIYGKPDVS